MTRSKKVVFNYINEQDTVTYFTNLNVGNTYNLSTFYGFSNILFKDYLFVSDDENIATVNQKGIITAVSTGSTKIKVYNKKTFNYDIALVNVIGSYLNNIDEFINIVNNKTVDIDVSSYDDINSYITSTYDMGEETIDIKYSRIAYDYITKLFDEKMNDDYQI